MTGDSAGSFRVWLLDGTTVVTAIDPLGEGNAQQFWEVIAAVTAERAIVVVDLSSTGDCDPRALAALVMALRHTDVTGGEIRVVLGASRQLLSAFSDAGLRPLVKAFDSLPEALEGDRVTRECAEFARLA